MTPDLSNAHWRKSTRSQNGGNCVEVAPLVEFIAIRDSKDPGGLALFVSPEAWNAFTAAILRKLHSRRFGS